MGIILTGVSQGLGKELFDILSQKDVCLVAVSRRFLDYQIELSRNNSNISLIKADLASIDSLTSALDNIKIDIANNYVFINNAGCISPIATVEKMTVQDIVASYNINMIAPAIITQKFSISSLFVLNISSGAAGRPIDNWSLYCSGKAGIKMFFDVIAESQNGNIEVIHFDPGVLDTNMQAEIRASDFSDKENFISLVNNNKLKSPKNVAKHIFKTYIEGRITNE